MIAHISPRKILHNYAIPIFATVLFIIVFLGLWLAHQYALASVKNIGDSNPLIVTDKRSLVSNDQSADPVIEQFSDGGAATSETTAAPSTASGQSQPGASATPRPASGGASGGVATKPAAPQAPFAVSLGSIQDHTTRTSVTVTLLGIVLGCTVDHQFKISVNGQNGPGTIKYRWVRSTGGEAVTEQKDFPAGSASVELTHTMTTSSWGEYWVNLEVISPNTLEKKYTFNHQC